MIERINGQVLGPQDVEAGRASKPHILFALPLDLRAVCHRRAAQKVDMTVGDIISRVRKFKRALPADVYG